MTPDRKQDFREAVESTVLLTMGKMKEIFFIIFHLFVSSPEHEVLMVSYCGQWLSVVVRRASCVNI